MRAAGLRGFVIVVSQPQSLTFINMPYGHAEGFRLCLVHYAG
jgi:hypothetical protein